MSLKRLCITRIPIPKQNEDERNRFEIKTGRSSFAFRVFYLYDRGTGAHAPFTVRWNKFAFCSKRLSRSFCETKKKNWGEQCQCSSWTAKLLPQTADLCKSCFIFMLVHGLMIDVRFLMMGNYDFRLSYLLMKKWRLLNNSRKELRILLLEHLILILGRVSTVAWKTWKSREFARASMKKWKLCDFWKFDCELFSWSLSYQITHQQCGKNELTLNCSWKNDRVWRNRMNFQFWKLLRHPV